MEREPKVNWFVTESAGHPFGDTGERAFPDGATAWTFAEELRRRDDVIHVQWEDKRPGRALTLPKGALLAAGWVRDDDTGQWREQYREQAGVGHLLA